MMVCVVCYTHHYGRWEEERRWGGDGEEKGRRRRGDGEEEKERRRGDGEEKERIWGGEGEDMGRRRRGDGEEEMRGDGRRVGDENVVTEFDNVCVHV